MCSCDRALELISLGLDETLDEALRQELEEHLSCCAACRSLARDLEALCTYLPELEEEVPEGFRASVMDRVRQEKAAPLPMAEAGKEKRPVWRRWGSLVAVCAVILLGVRVLPDLIVGVSGSDAAPQEQPENIQITASEFLAGGGISPDTVDPGDAAPEAAMAYAGEESGAVAFDYKNGWVGSPNLTEEERQALLQACIAWLGESALDGGEAQAELNAIQMTVELAELPESASSEGAAQDRSGPEIWRITLGDPDGEHVRLLWDPVAECVLEQEP